MNRPIRYLAFVVALAMCALVMPGLADSPIRAQATSAVQITTPEQFFGFQMGADRKLVRWDKAVEYYRLLERQSGGKLKVVDMGPTEMGNPFLLVIITSPANHARLETLRQMNLKLSDPRGVPLAEIKRIVAEGKVVICQTMSMHANEVGGINMAPELSYDLVSRTDAEALRILDNVVFLEIPSFNPDGAIMIHDYYVKYLGTEYEGGGLPWLYHKYIGHDNNRDALTMNMKDSQYVGKLMFVDWKPQAYVDHHHMGPYGARIYVPPYAEPIRPLADPQVWREMQWYGGHIAYKEEEAGLSGVSNTSQYSGWGHFGFHWITPFHNIAGMLTESASVRIATPLYIDPSQLAGGARGLETYKEQMNFPNPWPGGWWTLRGIVERQKVSAWATLDQAARNRETVLWNAYLKASRQTERGAAGKPAAYAISARQHDPLTLNKLVNTLLAHGIEVMRTKAGFATPGGMTYPAGSFYVSLAQPKMGLIRYLLGETHYMDNEHTRRQDGTPIRPYDMGQDVLAEFMGIVADPLDEAVTGDFVKVNAPIVSAGSVAPKAPFGYVLDGRLNDSFRAVNLLWDKGVAVKRASQTAGGLRAGDWIVPAGADAAVEAAAKQSGVDFVALKAAAADGVYDATRLRIGIYRRYRGGNMDEGWTRWLFEQWGFPFAEVYDAEILKGNLNAKYDVFIFADDSTAVITGEPGGGGFGRASFAGVPDTTPPEYRSGIGAEGVRVIKEFVQKGGTLVTLGGATDFAITKLGLPVRNAVAGLSTKDFFVPGSTLRVRIDNTHPLAYGMPAEGLVLFHYSPAFDVVATDFNDRHQVVVRYADRNVERSGWLNGEKYLAGKTAMASLHYGGGSVVLIGFRTQNRAQTHGTYKFLFNALVSQPARAAGR
ncbi:MAG: M14 family metallopeptidase [Vicinamibacterales bacterium]|nr:M14 family metallopeptidase [Vicinamibacterales bacterium]